MSGRTDTRFPHPISGDGAAPAKRPVRYWHLMDMAPSPLSGVKRTFLLALQMSANDPKRTLGSVGPRCALLSARARPNWR